METKRILIVDDDSTVARILIRVFERAGFAAQTASNGKQALTLLADQHFDALVSDIQMPHMDGRQLCKHLATKGPYFPRCVLIVTSRSEEEERSWVSQYPGVTLAEKPLSPKTLLRMVTRKLQDQAQGDAADGEKRAA